MESAGSAVVDFGRFCTGFLVVMGVGMGSLSPRIVDFSWIAELQERMRESIVTDVCLLIALPVLLAHCGLIRVPAMAMSIVGGLLIYGTIISFTMFFHEEQDF